MNINLKTVTAAAGFALLTSAQSAPAQGLDPEIHDLIQGCITQDSQAPQQCICNSMTEMNNRGAQEHIGLAEQMGTPLSQGDQDFVHCVADVSTDSVVNNYELALDVAANGEMAYITGTQDEYNQLRSFFADAINGVAACAQNHSPTMPLPDLTTALDTFDQMREMLLENN